MRTIAEEIQAYQAIHAALEYIPSTIQEIGRAERRMLFFGQSGIDMHLTDIPAESDTNILAFDKWANFFLYVLQRIGVFRQ